MFNYLEDVIVEAAEDLKNSCSYYSGNDQLFKVDDDSPRHATKGCGIIPLSCCKTIICKQEGKARHTSMCCISMHMSKITNGTRLQETWKSY